MKKHNRSNNYTLILNWWPWSRVGKPAYDHNEMQSPSPTAPRQTSVMWQTEGSSTCNRKKMKNTAIWVSKNLKKKLFSQSYKSAAIITNIFYNNLQHFIHSNRYSNLDATVKHTNVSLTLTRCSVWRLLKKHFSKCFYIDWQKIPFIFMCV